jgi:hypothetical protein
LKMHPIFIERNITLSTPNSPAHFLEPYVQTVPFFFITNRTFDHVFADLLSLCIH